jgi:predicted acyl esterase
LLTAANWGGQGIHPRGNFNGFMYAASADKWLEVHGDTHWTHFYSAYGRGLQKRFFDHFLKELDNGWQDTPRVQLNIRHPGERFVWRGEDEWPLARTVFTDYHLHRDLTLTTADEDSPAALEYDALGDGLLFTTPPFLERTEFTGPLAARLWISSETVDADLFLILRLFDEDHNEVTFEGSTDPNTPIANGWLRASHRAIVQDRSKPWQPFHPHDLVEPLTPGEVYPLDIEFVPTSIVVPPGYRLGLWIRGKDYEYAGPLDEYGENFVYATKGTGGMTHSDPDDRPPAIFGGRVTIYVGPDHPSHVLLPLIPG